MQVNIESVDFTAHMGDDGKVTYTDLGTRRRSDGSAVTQPVILDKANEVARKAGATHRDALVDNKFYKQGQFETQVGYIKGGEFGGWRWHGTYPPPSAGVI